VTQRPWLTTLAPILISFTRKDVSQQFAIAIRRRTRAQKVPKVVGKRVKLQPNSACVERATRKPRPFDRTLAFFDPLLRGAALVVKRDHVLSHDRQVRDDEAKPGKSSPGCHLTLAMTRLGRDQLFAP
jgi:hypothetical protein